MRKAPPVNIMTKEAFEFGLSTVERVIATNTITYGRPGRLPHKISRTERPKIASRTTVDILLLRRSFGSASRVAPQ